MITISICMIVKNEEKVLKRCLDSVSDLAEEIIIVDTGSTDKTMAIAKTYPNTKIYQFNWIDDFSAARNFAFSKATMEYIYSVDADEVLTEENHTKFLKVKQNLLPEIEIVQMKYANQLSCNSVYNFDEEYRPKLFKRVREFVWEGPIHETVRENPLVYDSDIVIKHMPMEVHARRDIAVFQRMVKKNQQINKRLRNMYAKELYISGTDDEMIEAGGFFETVSEDTERDNDEVIEACLIAAAAARRRSDSETFYRYAMKVMASGGCSEVCSELGDYYFDREDYKEAVIWYYNACYETKPILCLKTQGKVTLLKMAECYRNMGLHKEAGSYLQEAEKAVY